MVRSKVMWAIQHVPSGSWDNGDSNLTLYPFEYEAKIACVNDSFTPIRVKVTEDKQDGPRQNL